MKLFLITVNYNNSQATLRLLDSLGEQSDREFGTIVVDNASGQDDRAYLEKTVRERHPRVQLIWNHVNAGFSGGNNRGIKQALAEGADWLLFLNNDTWVDNDLIARVKASLPGASGILGIPLEEEGRISYCGKVSWLRSGLPHVRDGAEAHKLLKEGGGYVIGGGMLVRRDVFEKIGFWDERYFLYFEDADFSMRASRRGIPLGVLQAAVIHHAGSQSTKKLGSPLLLRYHWRNAHLFNWQQGPFWATIVLPFWSLFTMMKQASKTLLGLRRKESLAILGGTLDFYRGRFGNINDNDRH